jgi:hypothetical protein
MKASALFLLTAVSAGLIGCVESTPGRTRSLGQADYGLAFATAREVLAEEHGFSIESTERDVGTIQTRPKPVAAEPDRLLGSSPARQVATVRLRRDGNDVVAHVSVAVQRQRAEVRRQVRDVGENYDSVPNKSPAEQDAALTPQQKMSWETVDYDHALEVRILEDLYQALRPAEPPASPEPAEPAEPDEEA